MTDYPRGTVTFLFTDIAGSTRLWERHADAMRATYARHDAILRGAIEAEGGVVFKVIGDAFQAAFPNAPAAVAATLAAQWALAAEDWPLPSPLRVRSVLHACNVEPQDGDYRSPDLNRAGRLLSVGNGGQILLSAAVEALARGTLPDRASLRDLGERRLKDLARAERVFQLLHAELPDDFPPLKTLDYRPHNLPIQLTPFVGREIELAEVRARLASTRLLTLTGPGGIGKTRLALQAAAEVLERFADGVFFVAVETITDPELALAAIARAVGAREAGDRPLRAALVDHLRDRETLIVLDNVEQVVAVGPLLAQMLTECRGLTLLVTSRQRLRVHGEHEYGVPALGLPVGPRLSTDDLANSEAVRLFVERAVAAKRDFRLSAENAAELAAICRAVDGLPLAIELAAARVKLLPPRALLARLEDQLKLLVGGGRDRPERQQTLRGAIAWSHDLLGPEERALFRRLAVFAGGWSFEAAEAVCNRDGDLDVLTGLESLVDHSLVRQEEDAAGDPRFAMLVAIRAYAVERLAEQAAGEEAAVRALHAEYVLVLAEDAEPALTGPDQAAWLDRLDLEHDNVRAALAWLNQMDRVEDALRLSGAIWRFWWTRGHLTEGRGWLERALAQDAAALIPVRTKALGGAGLLAQYQNDYRRATDLHEAALSLYRGSDDRHGMARTLVRLGLLSTDQGETALAERRFQESLALYAATNNDRGVTVSTTNLGLVAFQAGDYDRAAALYEEALRLSRDLGDHQLLATALANLAEAREFLGDVERAVPLYHEALAHFRRLGDKQHAAFILVSLGRVVRIKGELAPAHALLIEGLELAREVGARLTIAAALDGLAAVAVAGAAAGRAARFFGVAEALREAVGVPLAPAYRADHDRQVAAARAALTPASFAEAWAEGRSMSLDEAVAEAAGAD